MIISREHIRSRRGTLKLGEAVIISDPSMDYEPKWTHKVPILQGEYKAVKRVIRDEKYKVISAIYIYHESITAEEMENLDLLQHGLKDILVESGLCGIYSENFYAKMVRDGTWTQLCCDIKTGQTKTYREAVIASSGYGDGLYNAYFHYTDAKNRINGILITFIECR